MYTVHLWINNLNKLKKAMDDNLVQKNWGPVELSIQEKDSLSTIAKAEDKIRKKGMFWEILL